MLLKLFGDCLLQCIPHYVKVIDGLGNVVERIERGRIQPADIGTEIRRDF